MEAAPDSGHQKVCQAPTALPLSVVQSVQNIVDCSSELVWHLTTLAVENKHYDLDAPPRSDYWYSGNVDMRPQNVQKTTTMDLWQPEVEGSAPAALVEGREVNLAPINILPS